MAQTDFNLYKQDLDPNPEPHEIVREGKTITVTGISAKDFEVNGTSLYEALLEKRTNLRALKQQYLDLVVAQETCLAGPTDNPPVITLAGANPSIVYLDFPYIEPGFTANDIEEGDLTGSVTVTGSVDHTTLGSYTLTYTVTDSDGNTTNIDRTVNVIVNNSPVITLTGSTVTINVGDTYVEPGYTATDVEDGDITASVVVIGTVDTSAAGTYTLTYYVVDTADGTAEVTRTVNVITNDSPVITLLGPATIDVTIGDTYFDPGYTAFDAEDGDITADVSVSYFETTNGVVFGIDTSTAGEYSVSYYVEDSDGNTHSLTRAVNVVAPSFRSVVFDIADNWGNSSTLGIRLIEFKLNGVLISVAGSTADATSQYGSGSAPLLTFTNSSKTGSDNGWSAAANTVINQRLRISFPSILQFDEIVINNEHTYGGDTDWGARNIVITGSTDVITDMTYGAAMANSTELFDGELAQHTPFDAADDQVIWTA